MTSDHCVLPHTASPRDTRPSVNDPVDHAPLDSGKSLRPLREEPSAYKIYKTISKTSNDAQSIKDTENAVKEHPSSLNGDNGEVIGNQFSFLVRKHDFNQRRFRNSQEEVASQSNRDTVDSREEPNLDSEESGNELAHDYMDENEVIGVPLAQPKSNNMFSAPGFVRNIRKKVTRKRLRLKRSEDKTDVIAESNIATRLLGQLCLGSVSVNLVASCLLEDDAGISRVPLLLSLISFTVTDVSQSIHTKNRRFRFDMVYGVGPQRMKWLVEKSIKDLLYMHLRIKFDYLVESGRGKPLPRFPSTNWRKVGKEFRHRRTKSVFQGQPPSPVSPVTPQDPDFVLHEEGPEAPEVPELRSLGSDHTIRNIIRARRSVSSADDAEQDRIREVKNEDFVADLNQYFGELINAVGLRPQLNRIFQFFEISPVSSLLSYETGYIGKQGIVHIGGTTASQGWRVGHLNASDVKGMIDRRAGKWFLIRNSYVMYVKNITSTSPLDVFLVDSKFTVTTQTEHLAEDDESEYDDSSFMQQKIAASSHRVDTLKIRPFQHLKITLENSERKLVLIPKSRTEQQAWHRSLLNMKESLVWSLENRFDSFAPVRRDCFAQWFVDGRDYMWAVSTALEMAKDVIFIHDWWLSPQLYLRRPANGNQQWRIDRLLQRKAQQGVKIYVIVYRNVGTIIPIDSLFTKHLLLSLNEENIHVIRSPNQLLQNTYFWAHHEKLCIIDHSVGFVGGIDLCYGRWDTPQHVLTDDSGVNFKTLGKDLRPTTDTFTQFEAFPGKDYSNPRIRDFSNLDKPYDSMYDRTTSPRMPWHDVHMMTTGKVARDLSRHFVQRWNYLIRQKRPSRWTPLLVPPPDMSDEEVKALGYEGTCEVQLLRSSGNWLLGLKETDVSIHSAYLKIIETSEHFVYIENQFFVTSCFIEGTEMKNRVGDALVERIIRAYNENKPWKAIIVIPLMPGFQAEVDESNGSSVRVIMQCQYRSISRGTSSIFAKLRKYGIDPHRYIQFFSLRKWGRIGPDRLLVTEQLYVHAKTIIVDDRIALIGSANINERSMRGSRDSEVAAIVRDSATVETTMNGEPFAAAKFAHTLRMRLMREHLGIDVDLLDIVERRFKRFEDYAETPEGLEAATNTFQHRRHAVLSAMVELASREVLGEKNGTLRWKQHRRSADRKDEVLAVPWDSDDVSLHSLEKEEEEYSIMPLPTTFNNRTGTLEANKGIRDRKKHSYDPRVQQNLDHEKDVRGEGTDKYKTKLARKARLTCSKFVRGLAHQAMEERPDDVFLPDLTSVREFLQDDDEDFEHCDDVDGEGELQARNQERWRLLKTLSYLQRVGAKQKRQAAAELEKARLFGVSDSLAEASTAPATAPTDGDASVHLVVPPNTLQEDKMASVEVDMASEEKPETINEEIPVLSLDEKELRETIDGLSLREADRKHCRYVDPYEFLDPVCDEFYHNVWSENAKRNTKIFRMTFHAQPDSSVRTWKDYKLYSKLLKAFLAAQQKDAKAKRHNRGIHSINYNDETDTESESESEDENEVEEPLPKTEMTPTINTGRFDEGGGILGDIPPRPALEAEVSGASSRSFTKQFLHNRRRKSSGPIASGAPEEIPKSEVDRSDTQVSSETISRTLLSSAVPTSRENDAAEGPFPHKKSSESSASATRRKRAGTAALRKKLQIGEHIYQRETAERILNETQGHLVEFPTEWLQRELDSGNWFYNTDRLPPLEIYS